MVGPAPIEYLRSTAPRRDPVAHDRARDRVSRRGLYALWQPVRHRPGARTAGAADGKRAFARRGRDEIARGCAARRPEVAKTCGRGASSTQLSKPDAKGEGASPDYPDGLLKLLSAHSIGLA